MSKLGLTQKQSKVFPMIEPYLYIIPALVLFLVFFIYPFIKTLILSFFTVTANGEVKGFVGIANFLNARIVKLSKTAQVGQYILSYTQ